jgi:hypothetical protein
MNLGSVKFATNYAKATAMTVYLMTAVKATVRPAFNYNDKKADKDSRKYSAANEFLYQIVCLGIAASMIPFCEAAGFKMAEKSLAKLAKNLKNIADIKGFEGLANVKGIGISGSKKIAKFKELHKKYSFDEAHVEKLSKLKQVEKEGKLTDNDKNFLLAEKAEHLISGGIEAGSLLGSIIGLTIAAPWISHQILHPIMHAIGMNKKQDNIGKPTETFLADAKVPNEKTSRLNANA